MESPRKFRAVVPLGWIRQWNFGAKARATWSISGLKCSSRSLLRRKAASRARGAARVKIDWISCHALSNGQFNLLIPFLTFRNSTFALP